MAVAVYVESGRVGFARDHLEVDAAAGTMFTLARLCIDHLAEARYPGRVDVGTRVAGLGRSSFTLGHGLFSGGLCIATAEAVLVYVEGESSRPIEGNLRDHLEQLQRPR